MADIKFPLLRLPLELREHIYSYYFRPGDRLKVHEVPSGGQYRFEFALFRVNKQIYAEARTLWRRKYAFFVRLNLPWDNAVHHISTEGLVPIVASGSSDLNFNDHMFVVEISSPRYSASPSHSIVLLLHDVPLFTRTWYYSALSFPQLNDALHVSFTARSSLERGHSDDASADVNVPLDLQKRILMPFENIKELYGTHFSNFNSAIVDSLLAAMATPHPPVHECLESCSALLEKGDQLLSITPRTTAAAEEALEAYISAFRAIHILIDGRMRRVLAEAYFHENITTGRFAGQMGAAIRIILRIRLVSRCVLCYLRLGELGEAAFWGMRSVRIMGEAMAMEFDDFMAEFVGSADIGLVNARTAIAFALLKRRAEEGDNGEEVNDAAKPAENLKAKWRKELRSYEGEELASSGPLWALAGKYLRGVAQNEARRMVVEEAKEFGVEIPEGTMQTRQNDSDMDSLSHLNLSGMAE